ncbi:inhibitor of growth protein 3-like [Hydractinia symbiolongicarpus]|uniref:inhibitor of growth protein 3-like n=1 Tax=Hydractinia symbiolongicarpus TaxID=13093 RepID=UPI00254F5763|nr:inhibitor of growth protein 3-like [Hydractinia symbiolongicarpus]
MLYLEDYIELIEQLPQDLRDRFTDMRELDLKVQNTIDTLDTRVRRFFSDAKKSKPEGLEEEYKTIHTSYKQALDDADEKVSMASQIYDLVDRHLRKLDQELTRFKMELEADCSGITEILERRSMVYNEDTSLDALYNATYNHSSNTEANQKRKFGDIERLSTASLTNGLPEKSFPSIYPLGTTYPLTKSSSISQSISHGASTKSSSLALKGSSASLLSSTKSFINENMKEQGRGVQASLKAMTAAQKKAEQLGNSLSMSGLLAPAAPKPTSSSSSSYVDVTGNSFLTSTPSVSLSQKHSLQNRTQKSGGRRGHKTISSTQQSDKIYPEPSLDWVPDPNEPTYCLCNQVSYGEMVGCDNHSCPIEWFHYGCVGLTDAPKGKWYCPDCSAQIKKRRIR